MIIDISEKGGISAILVFIKNTFHKYFCPLKFFLIYLFVCFQNVLVICLAVVRFQCTYFFIGIFTPVDMICNGGVFLCVLVEVLLSLLLSQTSVLAALHEI